MWEDEDARRYIRVGQDPEENDLFTELIKSMAIRLYHRVWGERHGGGRVIDPESDLRSYDESKIIKASNIMATTLSFVLPVITIFALNQVQSTNLRIALAAVFTAIFAFILAFISTAKRAEIFTATATYALGWPLFSARSLFSNTLVALPPWKLSSSDLLSALRTTSPLEFHLKPESSLNLLIPMQQLQTTNLLRLTHHQSILTLISA
jgi:hypothetical protein